MLDDRQKEATDHFNGAMMVLAGPGSGKTTVIANRTYNLIKNHGVAPNKILVITYTKSAALEMESRFKMIVKNEGGNIEQAVTFCTFHSLFFRILRMRFRYTPDNILGEDEKKHILREIVSSMNLEPEDAQDFIKKISEEIAYAKNEMLKTDELRISCCEKEDFLKIAIQYSEVKRQHSKIDFEDMQTMCYRLLKEEPEILEYWRDMFKYVLVDEFQDINKIQFSCIKLLCGHNNIFVVGDDDQSIYKFRGASPEFLLNFKNEFEDAKIVSLEHNYRSTENIIFFANRCISNNQRRFEKNIRGVGRMGDSVMILSHEDVNDEAGNIANKIKAFYTDKQIPYSQMAVVYRTNLQARAFIDTLFDRLIPFVVKDEMPDIYSHWINKDICAYMRLALNNDDKEAFKRIANRPTRYISRALLADAEKTKGNMMQNIINNPSLQAWQTSRIRELKFYLEAIKKRTPHEAFKYIRQAVDYNEYVKSYASFRKTKVKDLWEIFDELMESSKQYNTLPEYLDYVDNSKANLASMNVSRRRGRKREENAVTLSTLHSIKGMEYEVVFVVSCVEDVLPYAYKDEVADIEEERRLFYVGITRAKNHLFLSMVKRRHDDDVLPSRFLGELQKEKTELKKVRR